MIILFPEILPVSNFFSGFFRIFFKSSDFFLFDHISLHDWRFGSQIWYDNLLFWNCIRFPDFFQIFQSFFKSSDFFSLYHNSLQNWLFTFLKCDMKIFFSEISSCFQVFSWFSWFFSNLQISLVLTIFLYMNLKYDMINLFSKTSSCFLIISGILMDLKIY